MLDWVLNTLWQKPNWVERFILNFQRETFPIMIFIFHKKRKIRKDGSKLLHMGQSIKI